VTPKNVARPPCRNNLDRIAKSLIFSVAKYSRLSVPLSTSLRSPAVMKFASYVGFRKLTVVDGGESSKELLKLKFKMAPYTPQKSTGTKRTVSAVKSSRSSGSSSEARGKYVVCVSNEGYEASLEVRKIYLTVRDPKAEKLGLVRLIDESGEDYLYSRGFFSEIELSQELKRMFAR
jgi:hypothetical protein